jgi:hypothetical protein
MIKNAKQSAEQSFKAAVELTRANLEGTTEFKSPEVVIEFLNKVYATLESGDL